MVREMRQPSLAGVSVTVAMLAFVMVIGCGGGGGSTTGTATSTASATSTTTSTSTTTTTTTSNTTTTSTGGPSDIPSNVLIYSYGGPSSIQADYVSPTGSNDVQYYNFTSPILCAAPDPALNKFAFAYAPLSGQPLYDIYVGSSIAAAGATQLTNKAFTFVSNIQYSSDGSKIIFVGQVNNATSYLYAMTSSGSNMIQLDQADDAYLGPDNQTICYTKLDGSKHGQIWMVNIAGSGMKQITTDAWDHFGPQFSKDGTSLAWAASPNGSSYDIYSATAAGASIARITNATPNNAVSPAWAGSGAQLGYVLEAASNSNLSGVYTISSAGASNAQIVVNPIVDSGLFWSSSTGTLAGVTHEASWGRSVHILRLDSRGSKLR